MAVRTHAQIRQSITDLLADNEDGDISEADVRSLLNDLNDTLSDGDSNQITSVSSISPGFIDKNNVPTYFRIIFINRKTAFPTATKIRATLAGVASASANYRPGLEFHVVNFLVTAELKTAIAALTTRQPAVLTVDLLDASDQVVGQGEVLTMEVVEGSAIDEDQARKIADEEVNMGIENGVQIPARAAPGNEVNGERQYFEADFYAPDAEHDQVLRAHRNGSTFWGDATALTQAQQIGLLAFAAEPGVIGYDSVDSLSAQMRTIKLSILNPELLTGDIWVEGWTQGQRGLDRVKWAAGTLTLTITITELWADSAAPNLVAAPGDPVQVRLRFYDAADGGNEVERIGVDIPLVDLRRLPRAPDVIQAALAGADDVGAASLVLTVAQMTYRRLEYAVWGRGTDRIITGSIAIPVLAAQNAVQNIPILEGRTNQDLIILRWTPASRTLAVSGSNDRFIFAQVVD